MKECDKKNCRNCEFYTRYESNSIYESPEEWCDNINEQLELMDECPLTE